MAGVAAGRERAEGEHEVVAMWSEQTEPAVEFRRPVVGHRAQQLHLEGLPLG